jgi:hypothetical protein
MGRDPLSRLRAANPLPDLPAPGSPERVRSLIDDGYEPMVIPRRAARRSVGLLMAATLCALLIAATIALAATGVILPGAAVRPEEVLNPSVGLGVPAPGGSRLLSLRVVDPAGGLPWGMRLVTTTRGLVCVQIARVQNGQLGELGIDGAFHNDGRFHPIPPVALPRDEYHHQVFDSLLGSATTSCHLVGQAIAGGHLGVSPSAAAETPRDAGPPSALRDLYYGLLGSQAVSIAYRLNADEFSDPVLAPLGAYLIVVPASGRQQLGTGGESLGTDGDLPPSAPLTAITYRIAGKLCERGTVLAPWEHTHIADPCPSPRFPHTPAQERDLHRPIGVRLLIDHGLITGSVVTFSAPFAVTSASQRYSLVVPSVPCASPRDGAVSGGGGSTSTNIARGSLVTLHYGDPLIEVCPGRAATVEVQYSPYPGAGEIVGIATVRRPLGTRSLPPPRLSRTVCRSRSAEVRLLCPDRRDAHPAVAHSVGK